MVIELTKDTIIGFKDSGNTNIYLSDIDQCKQILDDHEIVNRLAKFVEMLGQRKCSDTAGWLYYKLLHDVIQPEESKK